MRNFELYLDESGKFINESKALSPSLIGGILVKKGSLDIEDAKKMMMEITSYVEGDYVHINDIANIDKKLAGKIAIHTLEQLKDKHAQIVIFENSELLDFKDDKILYLNIITEGIINLLEKLSLESSDSVLLDVIAAVRRDLKIDDDRTIIALEEYSQRIKERIYMKMAEKDLFLSKNCKVSFELSSARKNAMLMLADVVCNTRLTRMSSKFDSKQKNLLENIFQSSKYIFHVFRTDIQKKLSEYLIQNNIVDAIFLINEVDDLKTKEELIELIINNINTMSLVNLRIQLDLLSLKIRSLIDVQRNLLLCEKFLLTLQENIVLKITVKDFVVDKLKLDVSLYLLTIYTHLGNNIKSRKQIEISTEELKTISGSWNFLEYYYILKTRQAIYYNTCFDNEKSIEVLTGAINDYQQVLATMSKIEEFGSIKSDILAKAVGTRLQAITNLITPSIDINRRKKYYEMAVQDSECAIQNFVSKTDKSRQYQYRCRLELAVDNFEGAFKYLMKVLEINEGDFYKFVKELAKKTDFSKHFILVNYLEVMQYAVNHNLDEGLRMYEALKRNKNIYQEYFLHQEEDTLIFENKENVNYIHPFELIYWNMAKYFKNSNRGLAMMYFDRAIKICDKMNEPTVSVIELAIEADKLTIMKNIQEEKKKLVKKYKMMMEDCEFSDLHKFLNKFKDEFEYIELFDDINDIKTTCNFIATEIKI